MRKNSRPEAPAAIASGDRPRICVSCRKLCPRGGMIRLTWDKKRNIVVLDSQQPAQGRSAYICRKADCLHNALKGKKIQRSLKRAIPNDIVGLLQTLLKGL